MYINAVPCILELKKLDRPSIIILCKTLKWKYKIIMSTRSPVVNTDMLNNAFLLTCIQN